MENEILNKSTEQITLQIPEKMAEDLKRYFSDQQLQQLLAPLMDLAKCGQTVTDYFSIGEYLDCVDKRRRTIAKRKTDFESLLYVLTDLVSQDDWISITLITERYNEASTSKNQSNPVKGREISDMLSTLGIWQRDRKTAQGNPHAYVTVEQLNRIRVMLNELELCEN